MLSSERTHWLQNVISGKFPTSRDLAIASFCLETAKTRVVTAYPAASGRRIFVEHRVKDSRNAAFQADGKHSDDTFTIGSGQRNEMRKAMRRVRVVSFYFRAGLVVRRSSLGCWPGRRRR